MKRISRRFQLATPLLFVMLSSLVLLSCSRQDPNKIPITTSSREAREYYLNGRDLTDRLQNQEAIPYFTRAVKVDPNFAVAYLNLAFVQPTFRGFFETLDKAKALADKVSEGERLWIEGVAAGVNGFPMEQRKLFTKLVELYPQDERAHNLLASNYFGQQDYEKAIEEYRKATEIAPEFSQPYNQMGYAYRFLNKFNEAEEAFKKYIELIPNDPNPYDSYAELLLKRGKFEESIEMYKKALEQNPQFVASFVGIATNLNYMGKYEDARNKLRELLDNARNDGEARTALATMAVSFVDEGDFEKALEKQDEQYKIAEKNEDPSAMSADVNVTGNILLEMGDPDKALEMYQKSVELVDNSDLDEEIKANTHRFHHYNAAKVAILKGDLETATTEAESFMKQVTEINNPLQIQQAHELFGSIALEQEDWEKAIEELEMSSKQNPYNFYRLSLAYKGKGEMEKAKKYCTKAADWNGLSLLNYSFIRGKAKAMLMEM